ncbi:hypothetical protein TNIN_328581 [Trichonephila inaurata madagascariensis]|uniref:Uncharacterized protein n=1 Tax=Trichonephila inaurata madagascariensis TaxID=2747483 RepID=A0A8X6YB87_9ARAC|nr:hypothetical protein TNIN_328581 [Trichonephila inaurata madagascariensis]
MKIGRDDEKNVTLRERALRNASASASLLHDFLTSQITVENWKLHHEAFGIAWWMLCRFLTCLHLLFFSFFPARRRSSNVYYISALRLKRSEVKMAEMMSFTYTRVREEVSVIIFRFWRAMSCS